MIKGLILAIQFLTRIYLPVGVDFNEDNIRRSMFFFPYIGLFLGLIIGRLGTLAGPDLGPYISLVLLVGLTGGLHLDGLGDSFDGFFSGKSGKKALDIMADSSIGTFAGLGIFFVLLGKYIGIKGLYPQVSLALGLSMGNGRIFQIYTMAFKKPAKDYGLGYSFSSRASRPLVGVSIFTYLILSFFLAKINILILLISLIIVEIISKLTYSKIGGFTGDVYGGVIEIIETLSLLIFLEVGTWI